MKQLTGEEAKYFVNKMYEVTNPIKPHEARIIANILQTDHHQNDWRFKNHIFCEGCGRELTVLDMFLSGLEHHSPKYIHDYLYAGADGGGEIIYKDGVHPTIQVFKHGLEVACINCGLRAGSSDPKIACNSYFYKRPPITGCVISMSEYWYGQIIEEMKKAKPNKQKT